MVQEEPEEEVTEGFDPAEEILRSWRNRERRSIPPTNREGWLSPRKTPYLGLVRRSITSWADTWEHPIDDSSPTRETQEITDQLADAFQGISKVPEQVDDGIY